MNSFGYGSANAHAVIDNASAHVPSNYGRTGRAAEILGTRKTFLLPFSASTPGSLEARVNDLANYDLEDVSIVDLAHTLGLRRSHLGRWGFTAASRNGLRDKLTLEHLRTPPKATNDSPSKFAYVLTGQGAQWAAMCKELFAEFRVFRDSVAEMDSVLQSLPHPPR